MPVPDFQTFLLPVLTYAADGQDKTLRETYAQVADAMQLSDDARRALLPSGKQLTYQNRIGWAKTYLMKAGLLESNVRGRYRISPRGCEVLAARPARLTRDDLLGYPEFAEFSQLTSTPSTTDDTTPAVDLTPDEQFEVLHGQLRATLAHELLALVKACPPAFFEQLVVDVLIAMGYGGTIKDAGQALGRSGDGGIDGIVKQDRLGLSHIYLQAKRWSGNVGSPEVRAFAGALQENKALHGVLMTTGGFTRDAVETARRLGGIVLVDGEELARLMIDYGVGTTTAAVYEVKRVDKDYFEQD